jgi:peroxiredoxin
MALLASMAAIAIFAGCGFGQTQNAPQSEKSETEEAEKTIETKVEIGYMAPDFEAALLGGETVKLSDCRGKAALVSFWATWCTPCTDGMPGLRALADEFGGDLAVLAINCGEKKGIVEAFAAENGCGFFIGLDESGAIQKKYPTNVMPYTLIIDPAGIITEIYLGAGGGTFSAYEKDINAALGR